MADEDIMNPAGTESPATEAPAETPEPSGLEIVKRERDDYYDRLLRKTAEFDNYRKRVERERRAHAEQAVTDLLRELLLVVDDFDRALTVDAEENPAAYRKGIELIHAKLHDLLRKQGVRPIEAVGEDFDPNLTKAEASRRIEELQQQTGRGIDH